MWTPNDQIRNLQNANTEKNETIRNLNAELQDLKNSDSIKRRAYENLSNIIESQKNDITSLKTDLRNLQCKELSKDRQIDELSKRLGDWDLFVGNYAMKTGKELRNIDELINEMDRLRNSDSTRKEIISVQEKVIEELRLGKKNEIKALKTQVLEKEIQIKSLNMNNLIKIKRSKLDDSESDDASKQMQLLEHQLNERNSTIKTLNSLIRATDEKQSLQNNHIYNLKSENKFYKQKLEKLEEQISKMQGTLKEELIVNIDEESKPKIVSKYEGDSDSD